MPPLQPCHPPINLISHYMCIFELPTLVTSLSTSSVTVIMCLYISHILLPAWSVITCVYLSHLYPLYLLISWISIIYKSLDYCHLLNYHLDLSSYVFIPSLLLPPSYQLYLLSYVSIPPLYPFHLRTNLTCYHTCLSHFSTLANFVPTWPVITCHHMCLSHLSTIVTSSSTWFVIIRVSLPMSPLYQLDLSPYVSITALYLCHLRINLICHHMCLSHISSFSTFLPTWFVIIRLYPTSLPLPPSYQLDLLSYVSITLLYPCHILNNLTCYHTSLSDISILATFWPAWPVIICFYHTSLRLSHSYQLDMLPFVSIPPF